MIADKNRIYDGWVQLEAGVDAGRAPNLLDPNQARSAENVTFRGGYPSVRPGWRQLTENFPNPMVGYDGNGIQIQPGTPVPGGYQSDYVYKHGIFQTALAYSPHKGADCIMALIDGRLFKIVPLTNSATVEEVVPTDPNSPYTGYAVRGPFQDGVVNVGHLNIFGSYTANFDQNDLHGVIECIDFPNGRTRITAVLDSSHVMVSPSALSITTNQQFTIVDIFPNASYRNFRWSPIAYMVQADKWLIVQDGMGKAIIYDSKNAHRSNLEGDPTTTAEVPVGTMMAYGLGRVVVIVQDRDVAFGDLYGSHLDVQTDPADSIVLFTERNFLAGGFDAAIPFEQGVATGMQFFPQLDTSTGNGQLLVFAERGAASFNMAIDRSLWQTSQFQILALLTTGLRGHRSISIVNEDLWFRGDDGFRSFRQARSDSWGWAHIPLSTPVGQFLDEDDGKLLKFASSIYFDNRIIATTSPVWNVDKDNAIYGRVYHNGLVVVDFDVLSSFGTKYKPSWEGHWTIGNAFTSSLPDIKISQLLTGTFDGVTRAFAFGIDPDGMNQLYELSFSDRDDFCGQIPWELQTRAFDFKGNQQGSNQFTESEIYDGDIWISEISQGGIVPATPS